MRQTYLSEDTENIVKIFLLENYFLVDNENITIKNILEILNNDLQKSLKAKNFNKAIETIKKIEFISERYNNKNNEWEFWIGKDGTDNINEDYYNNCCAYYDPKKNSVMEYKLCATRQEYFDLQYTNLKGLSVIKMNEYNEKNIKEFYSKWNYLPKWTFEKSECDSFNMMRIIS
jgi:hypothetical protein